MENEEVSRVLCANLGYCAECGESLRSYHRHHYVTCSCGKSSLDGGLDYIRVVGQAKPTPVFTDDPFERVRTLFCRGGYGKDRQGEFRYTALKDMNDEYLENILDSEAIPSWQKALVFQEIIFRQTIPDARQEN